MKIPPPLLAATVFTAPAAWVLAATLFVAPVAWADDCPSLMKEVDAILESPPAVDEEAIVDEDLRKAARDLRAEAEKLYKAGKQDECAKVLERTILLLNGETG